MRDRVLTPGLLVDLRRIPMAEIDSTGVGIRIGPSVTLSQILAHDDIAKRFPALIEACRPFAGPPIRNRATIGGNIVNASPAADLVPPLFAYDASIVLSSVAGDRELPLTEFFTGPGQTVLAPSEILTEIRLPQMPACTAAHFIKLGQRRSMAISIVNLSTRLSLGEDDTVSVARIALGAVAPTAVRAIAAESVLVGKKITADLLEQAAQRASEETSPISDVRSSSGYRKRMTRVLVRRALMATLDRLEEIDSDG